VVIFSAGGSGYWNTIPPPRCSRQPPPAPPRLPAAGAQRREIHPDRPALGWRWSRSSEQGKLFRRGRHDRSQSGAVEQTRGRMVRSHHERAQAVDRTRQPPQITQLQLAMNPGVEKWPTERTPNSGIRSNISRSSVLRSTGKRSRFRNAQASFGSMPGRACRPAIPGKISDAENS
jgi:hypothetical protein